MRNWGNLKKEFELEKTFYKGGFIGKTLGQLTGGLIGEDPNKKARREAERAREEERRRVQQAEQKMELEKTYNNKLSQDTKTIEGSKNQGLMNTKPQTTADFSKSLKVGKMDDEDKLKKLLKAGRFS